MQGKQSFGASEKRQVPNKCGIERNDRYRKGRSGPTELADKTPVAGL